MPELECPRCHTRTDFESVGRDVQSFCPNCDYPMFFAGAEAAVVTAGEPAEVDHRRRLPGVGGVAGVAAVACWNCGELNAETAMTCGRCGNDLSGPPPVVAPEPEPEREPEPEIVAELDDVVPTDWSAWIVSVVLAVLVGLVWLTVGAAGPGPSTATGPCPAGSGNPWAQSGSVVGRVVDGLSGEGIGAVTVIVNGPGGTATTLTMTVDAGEDAAGSYVFCNLSLGSYTVSFSAPDHRGAVIPVILDDEAPDASIDARLDIVPTSLTGRVVVVAGTSDQPRLEPVSGLDILFDPTPDDPEDAPLAVGTTDETGAFAVTVPATRGEHSLIFDGDFLVDTVGLSVTPGTAVDAGEVVLVRLLDVSGSLVDEFGRDFGTIAELFEPPLRGEATIEVESIRSPLDAFVIDVADPAYQQSFGVTDGFSMLRLPGPATYTLEITAPPGLTRFAASTTATFDINEPETTIDVVVPFAPGVVWGTVTTTETVAPRMEVELLGTESGTVIATERTDGEGRVTFGPLPSEAWMVAMLRRDQAGLLPCSPEIALTDTTASLGFGEVVCAAP